MDIDYIPCQLDVASVYHYVFFQIENGISRKIFYNDNDINVEITEHFKNKLLYMEFEKKNVF